ncbi:hypothetical protein [Pseudogemmobacter bohemicus]|uniref:hypothetical protein n=1 Tax=Pseudogemmobacter bohemicus TaxID=2250708 RepID=UPI000DD32EED|nr:hypothetical protein [Pseudogemmobacter bohemicus]
MAVTNETLDDEYQARVVGFVDILGFGALVQRADRDVNLRREIIEALEKVRAVTPPGDGDTELRTQSFSDSLILSAANTPEGLWHLLLSIDALAWNLLQLGIFIRGGVTIGGMTHNDHLAFGTGVNAAYDLESKVAKMPRVILGAAAFDAAVCYASQSEVWAAYRNSRLLRDRDGVWFLNYLTELACFNRQHPSSPDMLHHPMYKVGCSIQQIFQEKHDRTIDQPDVYAKLEWFARYWNAEVSTHPDPTAIPVIGSINVAGTELRDTRLPFRSF